MAVRQCPKCELRFPDDNEVKQHLVDDHAIDPEVLEPHLSGRRAGVAGHRDVPDPLRPSRGGPAAP